MQMRCFSFIFLISIFNSTAFADGLKNYFPKNEEIKNWKQADTLKIYKGDELFTYIDGGADVYFEYGFKQVATVNYSNKENDQLQVEIYEMKDSSAAYGAYSFYLNGEGKKLIAGTDGMFFDYYAVFWKSNLLVVISAPVPNEKIIPVIENIAGYISTKIVNIYHPPLIVSKLLQSGITESSIKYFKGKVGLSNIYKFIPGNAFYFNEGVSFNMPETKVIIFRFNSDSVSVNQLSEALNKMKESNKDAKFISTDNAFDYQDFKANQIKCLAFKNYILVTISKNDEIRNLNIEIVKKVLN